ncbi:MAG: SDR family NAD(P)-dependent oxidoreductase, partial [Firmicutes bacterium]|nr:SDR family NAD(P)-dependent oxidoreductase [Bacillota bacterium]
MEFDFGLAGKNVLLYGGHSNIGRFATYGFAQCGAHVTIAARDMKSAQEVCDEALALGAASARCIKCDTTSYEETAAAADFALENTGRIDCVYHGVAWDQLDSFLDLPREYWDRLYEVNFKSVMNAWHYIIPKMIEAGGGNFVNVASVMGRQHATEEPVYGALKSAVIHLGQTIAIEHGKEHIRINFVAPGPTPPVDGRYTTGSPWA